MVKKLTKHLKNWECCKLTDKTSEDIIDFLVKNGMLPPFIFHDDGDIGSSWIIKWETKNESKKT